MHARVLVIIVRNCCLDKLITLYIIKVKPHILIIDIHIIIKSIYNINYIYIYNGIIIAPNA